MSTKKKEHVFVDAFDAFWDFVRRAEQDIGEYGHLGPSPPGYEDPSDDRFVSAYKAIRPYLRKFRKDRFFPVSAGLPFGPIRAETAHQALMYCLNPSTGLYGYGWFLKAPEYLAIKAEAIAELERREKTRRVPWKTKDLPCSIQAHILGELANLRGFLMERHFPQTGKVVLKPLKVKDIQLKFGWCQSTATRRMQALFKCEKAMTAYARVFSRKTAPDGYRIRLEDATLDIEAIYRQRAIDRDNCDANGEGQQSFDE